MAGTLSDIVWRTRTGGHRYNGGGYDPSFTTSGGQDYSGQDGPAFASHLNVFFATETVNDWDQRRVVVMPEGGPNANVKGNVLNIPRDAVGSGYNNASGYYTGIILFGRYLIVDTYADGDYLYIYLDRPCGVAAAESSLDDHYYGIYIRIGGATLPAEAASAISSLQLSSSTIVQVTGGAYTASALQGASTGGGTVDAAAIASAVWSAGGRTLTAGFETKQAIAAEVYSTLCTPATVAAQRRIDINAAGNVEAAVMEYETAANPRLLVTGDIDAPLPTALLDLPNAVETGLTLRQALRLMAAALAGRVSGADTNTIVIRNAVANTKPRITATVDASGNRTNITTDLT